MKEETFPPVFQSKNMALYVTYIRIRTAAISMISLAAGGYIRTALPVRAFDGAGHRPHPKHPHYQAQSYPQHLWKRMVIFITLNLNQMLYIVSPENICRSFCLCKVFFFFLFTAFLLSPCCCNFRNLYTTTHT